MVKNRRIKASPLQRAKKALWNRFEELYRNQINDEGYVSSAELNLIPGVSLNDFREDFEKGSGSELESKFKAVHSSSALVANTFGPWKRNPGNLSLFNVGRFRSLEFEKKCSTGLGGTPPNLDVLLESQNQAVGIESKFLEILTPKKPYFAPGYTEENLPQAEKVWWKALEKYRDAPPMHLDVAQLIKHYLGLTYNFSGDYKITLLYLFWKPENANEIPEYQTHEEELKQFQTKIADGSITFIAKSYPDLWEEWDKEESYKEHVSNLRKRYALEI